ncbi:MAG: hypothetical protein KDJ38_04495 [Gammaproteobacteria bacterium]|nr:hypothetical protein [Gammaproteobacteria bacterium]
MYRQRLLVTALCGLLAMNYPLLMLASQPKLIVGLPVLFVYLFGVWALIIVSVRLLIKQLQRYYSGKSTGQNSDA